MVKVHFLLAILGLVSGAFAKDLVLNAKFDPTQADNVESAAWNCIIDFSDDNGGRICGHDVTRGPKKKLADMCSMGNILLFDTLLHEYCQVAGIKRKGKYFYPNKRPCMRCKEGSKERVPDTTTTVVNINIIQGSQMAPTTVTIAPSGKPLATVTLFSCPLQTPNNAAFKKSDQTTFKTVVKTTTVNYDAPSAVRTCLSKPEHGSGEYDNGQWCVGKYEQPIQRANRET